MSQELTRQLHEMMPLAATLGISASAMEPGQVRLSLPWAPGLCTAAGTLHGGVIMTLADTAGGACAQLNLPPDAAGTTTTESKTNFLRAIREGSAQAAARVLHKGRTLIVVETEIRDSGGRLAAKVTQGQLVLR